MTIFKSVLGVLSVCRVDFEYPTQFERPKYMPSRVLCGVCWVLCRARACMTFFATNSTEGIFSYAKTDKPNKPNKPNTLNSSLMEALNLKGFICVGFVSGCGFSVSGWVLRGQSND
ncbi:hypothetical protein ACIOZM_21630 [Pseudomonas sp. NPDC087346]|uniref:hypothetical protein n=1 Tax=Pseudomonas sp. NPDC087346 TaxID=3364438 RepID=UPI00381366F9